VTIYDEKVVRKIFLRKKEVELFFAREGGVSIAFFFLKEQKKREQIFSLWRDLRNVFVGISS